MWSDREDMADVAGYVRKLGASRFSERAIDLIDGLALSHGLRLADALIAATAIEVGATLVTANVKHFGSVPGLGVEAFDPR